MSQIRFKMNELKVFSVVASSGSLSQASIILGIAQANISKYISDFEGRVGLKVFERTTRRISLTPFGEHLLPKVNQYLSQTDDLESFITDYKKEKRGKVTLYAPTGIVIFLSQHVIPKLSDSGEIRIELRTLNLGRNEFYDGVTFPDDADILLTYARPKDESLVACSLASFAFSAYASPEYLAQHPIESPEQLANHSCILMQSMLIDDNNIWNFCQHGRDERKEYKVTGKYICDNIYAATELARHGMGIVFASRQSIKADLEAGRLMPCFSQNEDWMLELVVIFKKRDYLPYRVQHVLDQMVEIINHYFQPQA